MIAFPEAFFSLLIYGSVGASVMGAVLLAVLLGRDWLRGRLW
jgi:hypothetical protein